MTRVGVACSVAPAPIGPYQQAVRTGNLVYTSGQLGIDPGSGELVEGVEAQTHRALKNLALILEAAGCSLRNVIKTTVFLANMDDFVAMNSIYAQYFPTDPPARSAFQVGRLPKSAKVEIEAVAEAE